MKDYLKIGFLLILVYFLGVYRTESKHIDDHNTCVRTINEQASMLKAFDQIYDIDIWKEKAEGLEDQLIRVQIKEEHDTDKAKKTTR